MVRKHAASLKGLTGLITTSKYIQILKSRWAVSNTQLRALVRYVAKPLYTLTWRQVLLYLMRISAKGVCIGAWVESRRPSTCLSFQMPLKIYIIRVTVYFT